jgi:hypothetical protein
MSKKEAIKSAILLGKEIGDIFGDIYIVKFKYGWDCVTDEYFKKYKKRKIYHTIKTEPPKDVELTKEDTDKLAVILKAWEKKRKK